MKRHDHERMAGAGGRCRFDLPMTTSMHASLGLAAILCSCSAGGRTSFVGTPREPVADGSAILVHTLAEAPSGHDVLGVVTATCDTYDGASGLAEAPCDEATLLADARLEAARRGGTLLVDPSCEQRVIERTLEQLKGGGARAHVRMRLRCRATVARGGTARVGAAQRRTAPSTAATTNVLEEEFTVANSRLRLRTSPRTDVPKRSPLETDATAELADAPPSAPLLGHVVAECLAPCASAVARRGAKTAAARLGATYLVKVSCDVIADRWRCEGDAHGEP